MLWIALIIAGVIALYELTWIGRSDSWWVLFDLAGAIAL